MATLEFAAVPRSARGRVSPGRVSGSRPLAVVIAAAFLALTAAAESPRPRGGGKLVVVNDDGFSAFFEGRYRSADDLRRRVAELGGTPVGVFEWCVTAGSRVNYPTKVSELIGDGMTEFGRRGDQLAAETVHRMAADGVDSLAVVAGACREAGLACYASIRMNGDYSPNGGAAWGDALARFLNSRFWFAHPEYRVRGPKGEDRTKLSYAFPAVRAFKLAIIREVLERRVDGVNLDFHRHPDFFGWEAPLAEAFAAKYGEEARTAAANDPRWFALRAPLMTEFVREVRALLDAAGRVQGRRLGLSVRIDGKLYRTWGCDLETWLQEGWLDYVVVGQRGLGGYEFDLAPFVRMARGRGCAVLFGEEAILQGHDRTAEEDRLIAAGKLQEQPRPQLSLEQYRTRAARWYAAGADGVHLFNENRLEAMDAVSGRAPAVAP